MFSGMEFGFLKGYLSLALVMFIVFSLLNSFWWKSSFVDLVLPYFGSMLFVLYLVYDFNRLQKLA
ncbi:MAG: Bax inhibitor-1 family protein [Patescibacteria group bacterium]